MARVFQTRQMGEAHWRVAIVNDRGMADLAVCRVATWGEARGDALWYITRDKQEADVWLYFGSIGFCELKVCFVPQQGQAGWLGRHQLRGRLARSQP